MGSARRKRLPGSYITQREANALSGLSCNAQAVYYTLRLCMNHKTGETQPIGYAFLMTRFPVSKSTLKRAVGELAGAGMLTRKTVGARAEQRNVYGFPKALDGYGKGVHG